MPKRDNSNLERFVLYLNPDIKEDDKLIRFLKKLRRVHRAGQWLREAAWAKFMHDHNEDEAPTKMNPERSAGAIVSDEPPEENDNPLDRIKRGFGL